MDLFLATCQGLGLALAAAALAGAPGRAGAAAAALAVIAAIVGAALFGISLADADHPAWPGWPVGALLAAGSFPLWRDVSAGARSRAEGANAIGGLIAVYAVALAGLSLVVSPIALVALAGTAWLATGRRRRAERKHRGLRVLR